jgi:hypothetical protein
MKKVIAIISIVTLAACGSSGFGSPEVKTDSAAVVVDTVAVDSVKK